MGHEPSEWLRIMPLWLRPTQRLHRILPTKHIKVCFEKKSSFSDDGCTGEDIDRHTERRSICHEEMKARGSPGTNISSLSTIN